LRRPIELIDRELLNNLHNSLRLSLREISVELGCSVHRVLKSLKAYGWETRTKSEAVKAKIEQGRFTSPTKGRPRPESVRLRISERMKDGHSRTSPEDQESN
jgi:hypothetical protein